MIHISFNEIQFRREDYSHVFSGTEILNLNALQVPFRTMQSPKGSISKRFWHAFYYTYAYFNTSLCRVSCAWCLDISADKAQHIKK